MTPMTQAMMKTAGLMEDDAESLFGKGIVSNLTLDTNATKTSTGNNDTQPLQSVTDIAAEMVQDLQKQVERAGAGDLPDDSTPEGLNSSAVNLITGTPHGEGGAAPYPHGLG